MSRVERIVGTLAARKKEAQKDENGNGKAES